MSALPDCRACPGDGTICPKACKLAEDSPPIAPPVAAGSVDTEEFRRLLTMLHIACFDPYSRVETKAVEQVTATLIVNINAWGAQQREAGWVAGRRDQYQVAIDQRDRAEKAEAELEDWSQSNRLDELQRELIALQARAKELEAERDTLKESLRLVNLDHGLWMTRTHAAEDARDDALARVKELEALHDAAGRLIKAKGCYHTEKNYRALAGAYDAANTMQCTCRRCQPNSFQNNRMILCSTCGNKRCPHANDHQHACTGSNEPGQPGSAY